MDRKKSLNNHSTEKDLFEKLLGLNSVLDNAMIGQFDRSLPFNENLFDRWDRANKLGFKEGSSIYDLSYVYGEVSVGKDTWIGPYTMIDGSGGLTIGSNCTISAGVHIYTHNNLMRTLMENAGIEQESVSIGDNCYLAPNSIISMGVSLGNKVVVGANSFVNKSFGDNVIIAGNPAKTIAEIVKVDGKITFKYL